MFKTTRIDSLILLALLTSIAELSGCVSSVRPDNMHVEDRSTKPVFVSAVYRLKGLEHDGRVKSFGGVEVAYERYIGHDSQFVATGNYASLNDQRIDGPQQLQLRTQIEHARIGYDHLFVFARHFELEPSLSFTYETDQMNAWVNAPGGPSISRAQHEWGLSVGLVPRWMFNRYVGVETRGRLGVSRDGSTSDFLYPALVLKPFANAAISAGYIWYDKGIETPTNSSNFITEQEGPMVSLRLMF